MDVSKKVVITEVAITGLTLNSVEAMVLYKALMNIRDDESMHGKWLDSCPNLDKLMELMEKEEVA